MFQSRRIRLWLCGIVLPILAWILIGPLEQGRVSAQPLAAVPASTARLQTITATQSITATPGLTATQFLTATESHANAHCLMCHGNRDFTGRLQNGETISLYVDPAHYYQSVHAPAGLECLACHTNQKDYPHQATQQVTCLECHGEIGGNQATTYKPLVVELAFPDARSITLAANESCRSCHADRFAEAADSAHARVQASGNREAPLCVDCHGSHAMTKPDQPRAKISDTCANCHSAVYTSYRTSVHGAALEVNSNPDVPTCVDCHGVHNIHGPRDPEFRNKSIGTCGTCHADKDRMTKYGLSTDVLRTYLDDFHGRTVDFFRRQSERTPSSTATCFDCHGIHSIRPHTDPQSSVYPANLQKTCQQCHENASITFPQAWLSHYVPSVERTPGLVVANTAYQLLIPGTLLGMLGYIVLDMRRRALDRKHTPRAPHSSEDEIVYYDDDHTAQRH